MTHRIFLASVASLGALAFIWLAAQHRWERQVLAELKHGGRL